MTTLEKDIEVAVPVTTAYNQWTQFETFPQFMDGVKEVRQIDDTHLSWRAEVAGKEQTWDAEITQQIPDKVIAWTAVSGPQNAGQVMFEPIDDQTSRVTLRMDYEPQDMIEKAGGMMGMLDGQIDSSLKSFKEFIESTGTETGAWRGEV